MKVFRIVNLETSSLCNRFCPTCLRNSHPDREVVKDWFTQNLMPMEMIEEIFRQCAEMEYMGRICLTNFNEPLLDPRIVDIVRLAVDKYGIEYMHIITNGDYLTQELADQLDGVLHRITISLYDTGETRYEKRKAFKSMFKETNVIIKGEHITTHFNPKAVYVPAIPRRLARIIINHKGNYMMCCDDIAGEFDLGSLPEMGLLEFWQGEKFQRILKVLSQS